jgi:hypothetical protein
MTKSMSLRSEIITVLIFKISALVVLKYIFFSDPTQRSIQNSPERVTAYFFDQTPEFLQGNVP